MDSLDRVYLPTVRGCLGFGGWEDAVNGLLEAAVKSNLGLSEAVTYVVYLKVKSTTRKCIRNFLTTPDIRSTLHSNNELLLL
jgi:hypothetical protein